MTSQDTQIHNLYHREGYAPLASPEQIAAMHDIRQLSLLRIAALLDWRVSDVRAALAERMLAPTAQYRRNPL